MDTDFYQKLLSITLGLNRRFPNGNHPYQIMTRLLEESGELAQQVHHFEGAGVKREKYGQPDRAHLAKEVMDVLRCALQISLYYGIESELIASIETSYQRMLSEGLLEEESLTLPQATLCFLIKGSPVEQVLLGTKKSGFGHGKVGGFGGKVEPGESIGAAAARELAEEAGLIVPVNELRRAGRLTFLFPFRPAWSQVVHVFLARNWQGEPAESDEMEPTWFRTQAIPYERMWQDALYWLPPVLIGAQVQASFIFKDDNETIESVQFAKWECS
jgi:8-oxo-dGTP diphosphatase